MTPRTAPSKLFSVLHRIAMTHSGTPAVADPQLRTQGMHGALDVDVRLADFNSATDANIVLELLNMYASDPLGGGKPLSAEVRERLIPDLRQQPSCRTFVAFQGTQPVGLAICFFGYSSFHARPLLNIHDLAVV